MDTEKKAAEIAYHAGNYLDAAERYRTIAIELDSSDPVAAAEAYNNCSVALIKAGDGEGALAAAAGTEVIFRSAGDYRGQAIALANQGSALELLGRMDEAEQLYQESAELFKQLGESELYSMTLKCLSSVQIKAGNQMGALASMHAALNRSPKLSGKEKILKRLIGIPFRLFKG